MNVIFTKQWNLSQGGPPLTEFAILGAIMVASYLNLRIADGIVSGVSGMFSFQLIGCALLSYLGPWEWDAAAALMIGFWAGPPGAVFGLPIALVFRFGGALRLILGLMFYAAVIATPVLLVVLIMTLSAAAGLLCKKCGASSPAGSTYCSKCGGPIQG